MKVVIILMMLCLYYPLYSLQTFVVSSSPLQQQFDLQWSSKQPTSEIRLGLQLAKEASFRYSLSAMYKGVAFELGEKEIISYLSFLPRKSWQQSVVAYRSHAISYLYGPENETLLYTRFGRLFIGYLTIPKQEQPTLFAEYKTRLEGKLLCFGWEDHTSLMRLHIEAFCGTNHALTCITSLTLYARSLKGSLAWGNHDWPYSTSLTISMNQPPVKAAYTISSAVGAKAIYGGSYQAYKASCTRELRFQNVLAEQQISIQYDQKGEKRSTFTATISYEYDRIKMGYRFISGTGHMLFMEKQGMYLSVSKNSIDLKLNIEENKVKMIVRYTKKQALSLHFYITCPIGQDSGSPLPE